jgi:hypothetical protein
LLVLAARNRVAAGKQAGWLLSIQMGKVVWVLLVCDKKE